MPNSDNSQNENNVSCLPKEDKTDDNWVVWLEPTPDGFYL